MSGLIGFQNQYRSTLQIVDDKNEMLKFYPLIDWNSSLVEEYIDGLGLPQHPLKNEVITQLDVPITLFPVQVEVAAGRMTPKPNAASTK
jgi:3'-phosphoadenosine 5'-phosphosulfate sulfotransferase (PAPS reductase)/FAD synthetase